MGYSHTAKNSGHKLSLTWFDARKTWKKRAKGKTFYFRHPNTADGYQKALLDWAKQQAPPDPHKIRHELQRRLEWYQQHGDPEGRAEAIQAYLDAGVSVNYPETEELSLERKGLLVLAAGVKQLGIKEAVQFAYEDLENTRLWKERFDDKPKRRKTLTIPEAIDLFLAEHLRLVVQRKRKASTYGSWVDRLQHTKKNLRFTVAEINEATISGYHSTLVKATFGGVRQKNLFKCFKAFVRWCWENGHLQNMPRNINKPFEFADSETDREIYTSAEIKASLAKLPARGRAAVLLGLNCGFTIADLADLRKHDPDNRVDLTAGRIVYKRVKMRRKPGTPVVNFRLWLETIEVLRECESNHPELWFTTDEGLPLKNSMIIDGKESKWTAFGNQWSKWQEAGKVPRSQKWLRKTSSTHLANSDYSGWENYFLGHAPTTTSGKHYVIRKGQPIPQFDEALNWLRGQYEFTAAT